VIAAAVLLCTGAWASTTPGSGDGNLLTNSDFKSNDGALPAGWKVETLPACGFRFLVHQHSDAAAEFEMINDEPIEATLEQSVHLKPGWYSFTAELKMESIGTSGMPPELFVKAETLPIQSRVHEVGWSDDWRKLHVTFRTGSMVPDVFVGISLGWWGGPNTGRVLIRNPLLVPAPHAVATEAKNESADLEVAQDPDLENIADVRYGKLYKEQATFSPTSHPLSRPWTVVAAYAALLILAFFGWRAVSPIRAKHPLR
jgi:hypothetical protein